MAAEQPTSRILSVQPSPRILTDLQATTAYTLGRFLALARMAGDPLYRLSNHDIVQRMKGVAADYETVQKGEI